MTVSTSSITLFSFHSFLPQVDWEKEIDEELEKQKRKKKSLTAGGGGSAILGAISSPNSVEKVSTSKPTPIPAPLPKPKVNIEFLDITIQFSLLKLNFI